MPVAAPVAAALVMAAATVGTAVISQQMAPGMPKPPEPLKVAPPSVPKEIPEVANTIKEGATKDANRAAAIAAARKRATTRQAGASSRPSMTSPLGTVNTLGG